MRGNRGLCEKRGGGERCRCGMALENAAHPYHHTERTSNAITAETEQLNGRQHTHAADDDHVQLHRIERARRHSETAAPRCYTLRPFFYAHGISTDAQAH